MGLRAFQRALLALAASLALALPAAAPAQAPEAQAAARSIYLLTYSPGPAWVQGRPVQEQGLIEHFRYMQRLLAEGRLFAAGPFVGDDGGMAVIRASSIEEAREILAADPAITAGKMVATIRHWRPMLQGTQPLVD